MNAYIHHCTRCGKAYDIGINIPFCQECKAMNGQKKIWLDNLFYKIGMQQYDFRVNGMIRNEDGSVSSTKWKRFSEVVFPIDFGEEYKIDIINNREMLPIEVVIDLEDSNGIEDIVGKIIDDNLNFYVFKTGSRGFHIHIFFREELSNEEKLKIIKRYGGDEQKAHQGTTIALEYSPHWKTGKIKLPYYFENGN